MEMGHGTAAGGPHRRAVTKLSVLSFLHPVSNFFPIAERSSGRFHRELEFHEQVTPWEPRKEPVLPLQPHALAQENAG